MHLLRRPHGHTPVADLADFLRAEVLGLLKAFFDDSGTHGDALITALVGYVASSSASTAAETEWADTLADYRQHGVTWYHATDVTGGKNEWAGVPSSVRHLTPMRFAKILGASNLMPIWTAVVNEDFRKFATPEFLADFPTPFDLCYEEALRQMYRFAVDNHLAMRIAPMFSLQDSHAPRMLERYRIAKSQTDLREYLQAIGFDDPRTVLPLQMADLVANKILSRVDRHRVRRKCRMDTPGFG